MWNYMNLASMLGGLVSDVFDIVNTAIWTVVGQFLYAIWMAFAWIINVIEGLFRKFAGLRDVYDAKGEVYSQVVWNFFWKICNSEKMSIFAPANKAKKTNASEFNKYELVVALTIIRLWVDIAVFIN